MIKSDVKACGRTFHLVRNSALWSDFPAGKNLHSKYLDRFREDQNYSQQVQQFYHAFFCHIHFCCVICEWIPPEQLCDTNNSSFNLCEVVDTTSVIT